MVAKRRTTPQALRKQGDALEVSQGTIKTWRRCRALYAYRYIDLLERRRPILQLIRGTMLGKCFDAMALRRAFPTKKMPPWQAALDPYKKEYGKMFTEEREYFGDILTEVERIATRYEKIYANDGLKYHVFYPQEYQLSDGKKAISGGLPFELPIRIDLLPGIVFTGHIDKMPMDKAGRVWDMDHKSHKNIPDPEDRFRDLQQVFYQWAMPLSGYPRPAGVIWDYVRTKPPAIPEVLKNGELTRRKNIDTDYETYMGEIERNKLNPKDYVEILEPLKQRGHMDFYQRVQLPSPSKELVANVVADAKATALEIREKAGKDRTRSVDMTCKRCEFYNLCQTEFRGLDASFIRKSEYQIQKDPRHVHLIDND